MYVSRIRHSEAFALGSFHALRLQAFALASFHALRLQAFTLCAHSSVFLRVLVARSSYENHFPLVEHFPLNILRKLLSGILEKSCNNHN